MHIKRRKSIESVISIRKNLPTMQSYQQSTVSNAIMDFNGFLKHFETASSYLILHNWILLILSICNQCQQVEQFCFAGNLCCISIPKVAFIKLEGFVICCLALKLQVSMLSVNFNTNRNTHDFVMKPKKERKLS